MDIIHPLSSPLSTTLLLTILSSLVGMVSSSVAMTLAFDGTQYVAIRLAHEASNEVEDISLRFRTLRSNGLLFMTTSNSTNDRLIVALEVGEIRLDVAIGSHFQVCGHFVCIYFE